MLKTEQCASLCVNSDEDTISQPQYRLGLDNIWASVWKLLLHFRWLHNLQMNRCTLECNQKLKFRFQLLKLGKSSLEKSSFLSDYSHSCKQHWAANVSTAITYPANFAVVYGCFVWQFLCFINWVFLVICIGASNGNYFIFYLSISCTDIFHLFNNILELNTACRLNTALQSQTIKNSVWALVTTIW